jgi:hypothetical protein
MSWVCTCARLCGFGRQKYARNTPEIRQKYARNTPEIRQKYGRNCSMASLRPCGVGCCLLYCVYSTVCTVLCVLCVQYCVYSTVCTVCTVLCVLCVQYCVYCVYCTVSTVLCVLYCVYSTVCTVLCLQYCVYCKYYGVGTLDASRHAHSSLQDAHTYIPSQPPIAILTVPKFAPIGANEICRSSGDIVLDTSCCIVLYCINDLVQTDID